MTDRTDSPDSSDSSEPAELPVPPETANITPESTDGENAVSATAEVAASNGTLVDADVSIGVETGTDAAPVAMPVPTSRRISVAIVAMGGQGGGVLADWFVALAEGEGWWVQTTSVPGVAQRTGATIYYVELFEPAVGETAQPVMALMPGSGDVDLVIAAEWMEAGRAVMRGLVTPDKTTMVASTHRSYATVEKMVPGNGMADSEAVRLAATQAARSLIAFDMAQIASDNGTVVSAALFGAVAGSGALPFELSAYEAAVRAGGVGVESSLRGLQAAHDTAQAHRTQAAEPLAESPPADHQAEEQTGDGADALVLPSGSFGERIAALPAASHVFALEGVRRCVDYLDADYAAEYLDRLEAVVTKLPDDELITELARWLALRMCYEDPVRVADLKVRASRFADIRNEVRAAKKQIVHHTEFMHPRWEEITDTLPVRWSEKLQRSALAKKFVMNWFGKGLLFKTSTLKGFASVWLLSRMSHWRRESPRHARETRLIDEWIAAALSLGQSNPALGRAVVRSARLIKGYGDTHERGSKLYKRLSGLANRFAGRPDGGAILDFLIDAALADDKGTELDKVIAELNEHDANREQTTLSGHSA